MGRFVGAFTEIETSFQQFLKVAVMPLVGDTFVHTGPESKPAAQETASQEQGSQFTWRVNVHPLLVEFPQSDSPNPILFLTAHSVQLARKVSSGSTILCHGEEMAIQSTNSTAHKSTLASAPRVSWTIEPSHHLVFQFEIDGSDINIFDDSFFRLMAVIYENLLNMSLRDWIPSYLREKEPMIGRPGSLHQVR